MFNRLFPITLCRLYELSALIPQSNLPLSEQSGTSNLHMQLFIIFSCTSLRYSIFPQIWQKLRCYKTKTLIFKFILLSVMYALLQ